MKKMKTIFTLIMSIILIFLLKSNVKALASGGELNLESIPQHSGQYGKPYYHMTNSHMTAYNNVYCVKPGYAVRDHMECILASSAYIDGDNVTFSTYNSVGQATGNTYSGTSGIHNNILAAILCAESWDYGPYASLSGNPLPKTDSQKSLNAYWDTWVYKSSGNDYGMRNRRDWWI